MDASKIPSAPEIKLHFLDYWRIIRVRKTIIFSVFLLVVITATLVSLNVKKTYLSTVRIQVEKDIADIPEFGQRGGVVQTYDPFFITTQFEVLRSSAILNEVIKQENLMQKWGARYNRGTPLTLRQAYELLSEKRLSLQQTRNTSLIEIRVVSQDAQEAADIANRIAEVYKEFRIDQKRQHTTRGLASLEKQREEIQAKQIMLAQKVSDMRAKYKIVDLEADGGSPLHVSPEPHILLELNRMRNHLELEMIKAQQLHLEASRLSLKELRHWLPPQYQGYLLSEKISQHLQIKHELQTLQEQGLGNNEPSVKTRRAHLQELDEDIDGIVAAAVSHMASQAATFQNALKTLDTRIEEEKSKDRQKREEQAEYWRLKRELNTVSETLSLFEQKMHLDRADSNLSRQSVVTVLDEAIPSEEHYRPNIPVNIALGIVFGLIVGVGLAFFIEYLDTSVKTIDDVERAVQAPVLGVIPQNVGKIIEEGPESPHAEAYRVLRTNILFSRKNERWNTLTIVSGGAGEGKSTTLFNLATVFAQAGERVLIVDSDLRRPSLHKMLSVSNSIGLTNYLLRQNSLEEVIQTTPIPTLDLMASGKLPSSSMGILSSPQMKELIQELKQRYDYVFFDSPPIMGVSDASILASQMDMTLQVIQYRRYPQQMTIRAKQLIEKVGGNLVGIVLNNISMGQDDNYYYYSGYYYDYYSKQDDEDKPARGKKGDQAKVEIKQKF